MAERIGVGFVGAGSISRAQTEDGGCTRARDTATDPDRPFGILG